MKNNELLKGIVLVILPSYKNIIGNKSDVGLEVAKAAFIQLEIDGYKDVMYRRPYNAFKSILLEKLISYESGASNFDSISLGLDASSQTITFWLEGKNVYSRQRDN